MPNVTRAALLLIASSACTISSPDESGDGGTGGTGGSATCVAPSGQYLMSFQETGGNCGAQPSQYPVFDGTKQALSAGCSGDYTSSNGGCHDSFNLSCPLTGQQTQFAGSLDWTPDGKGAHGDMTWSLVTLTTNGSGQVIGTTIVCSSSYSISLVKT
jgi:hypothetical protein